MIVYFPHNVLGSWFWQTFWEANEMGDMKWNPDIYFPGGTSAETFVVLRPGVKPEMVVIVSTKLLKPHMVQDRL